jgi:hypothetical protein
MFIEFVKEMIETVVKDAIMPTGKNLTLILRYAISITMISTVLRLFGFPVYLSTSGCVLCVVVLLVIFFIERREYKEFNAIYEDIERRSKDEVFKLRRDVELRAETFKSRQQNSGTCNEDARVPELPEQSQEYAGRGTDLGSDDYGEDE